MPGVAITSLFLFAAFCSAEDVKRYSRVVEQQKELELQKQAKTVLRKAASVMQLSVDSRAEFQPTQASLASMALEHPVKASVVLQQLGEAQQRESSESSSGSQGVHSLLTIFQRRLTEPSKATVWKDLVGQLPFLSFIESVGNGIPTEKQERVRSSVGAIINLLSDSKDHLKKSFTNTFSDDTVDLNQQKVNMQTAETSAALAWGTLMTDNSNLGGCLAQSKKAEAKTDKECKDAGEEHKSCVEAKELRFSPFSALSKEKWPCTFSGPCDVDGNCEKPAKCTSAVKADAESQMELLKKKRSEFVRQEEACLQSAIDSNATGCNAARRDAQTKATECERDHTNLMERMCLSRVDIQSRCEHRATFWKNAEKYENDDENRKKEWKDLQLITCMFKTFESRANMTFHSTDHSVCQEKIDGGEDPDYPTYQKEVGVFTGYSEANPSAELHEIFGDSDAPPSTKCQSTSFQLEGGITASLKKDDKPLGQSEMTFYFDPSVAEGNKRTYAGVSDPSCILGSKEGFAAGIQSCEDKGDCQFVQGSCSGAYMKICENGVPTL